MDLTFFGATGTTTGSCHRLRVNGHAVLFDCGLYQGRREESRKLNASFAFDGADVHAVVQSHAHIDHSGKLPVLVRAGFRGRIHATHGTRDLCEVLLLDSASIQRRDAEHVNERRKRSRRSNALARAEDEPPWESPAPLPESDVVPLYLEDDVRDTMALFERSRYGAWFDVTPGVRCRFHDAGHILGSAWVEAEISERGATTRLVFTGDYGRPGQPILRDPEPLCEADLFISESTYGDRSHPPLASTEDELAAAVERLARRGRGRLLVPVFAVGRAQNILYTLQRIFARRAFPIDVVVDSPLATATTRILERYPEYYDEEALSERARLLAKSSASMRLCFTESVDESKALNRDPRPVIVLAGSGMLESGRILHHLAWHVSSEDTEVVLVGYQAANTLGRKLLEGARSVNVLGNAYRVAARVTSLQGFSAHADREGLLAALTPHAARSRALFLVHGENDQRLPLQRALAERGFVRVEAPAGSAPYEL